MSLFFLLEKEAIPCYKNTIF
ncbi:MAG: hypothetical protein Greene071421_471, partial [Parcubacteria group bacterium Greene0714_21]